MQVWRITDERYADDPLSGEGARRYGGRFNSRGSAIVYTSSTLSLAVLEVVVQRGIVERLDSLVYCSARIPEGTLGPRPDLPEDWNARPPRAASQHVGDRFVRGKSHLAMPVPSVVLPPEDNILINPAHPQFGEVEVSETEPLPIDPRLAQSLQ